MTTDIQADLAAIRKMVGEQEVCELCGGHGDVKDVVEDPDSQWGPCVDCNGTGHVPNPQHDGLRKVVFRPCTGCPKCRTEYAHITYSGGCHGTGYVLRSWDGPPGMLPGAFKRWIQGRCEDTEGTDEMDIWHDLAVQIDRCFSLPNCDAAATRVVREFLEREKP